MSNEPDVSAPISITACETLGSHSNYSNAEIHSAREIVRFRIGGNPSEAWMRVLLELAKDNFRQGQPSIETTPSPSLLVLVTENEVATVVDQAMNVVSNANAVENQRTMTARAGAERRKDQREAIQKKLTDVWNSRE